MRTLSIALFISLIGLTPVQAQMAPMAPIALPTTYPEQGTFCGFLKLCGISEITSDEKS